MQGGISSNHLMDPLTGCFLLYFQTIRKLILNCASSYVFFIRNAMFTVKFPAHDTPGNFTFIAVLHVNLFVS